jgi:hypothetical protein
MKLSVIAALTLSLGAGCSVFPRTYVFETPRPHDEALDLLARRLEHDGHKVSTMDRHGSEIVTLWEKSTAESLSDEGSDRPTALFVRYHVEVHTVQTDHKVKVWAEAQRCADDTFTVTPNEVIGGCRDVTWIPAGVRASVEDLGRHLSAELSSPPTTGGTAVASASCPN